MYHTIFTYVRPIWEGKDGKPSIKRLLAIVFAIDFISNTSHAVYKWDAGKSLEGLSSVLTIEGALIAALLGLTSYFNYKERKLSAENPNATITGGDE